MSDYIKREDAIRQIVKTSAQNELDIPAIGTVIYILSEMDSADVRENVRGEWHDGDCSYCGWSWRDIAYDSDLHNGLQSNFCPNCGADMKGE